MRESARRLPRAAIVCALVAFLNSAAWAILLPPLQAHDEPAHIYYVQRLAESGKVPRPTDEPSLSPEQQALANGVHQADVVGNPSGKPPWSEGERRALEKDLQTKSRQSPGGNGDVGSYTPLYYLTLAIPYKIGSSGTLIDRIALMRIGSALYAGLTVLFVFLFLRELFPDRRWLWTAGALIAAFAPVFAYMSGAVNPDGGLFAASALIFYLLARGFRRGITGPLAAAIGLAVAAGILMKVTTVAFVPGVALAMLVMARRRGALGSGLRVVAAAAGAFIGLMVVYEIVNVTLWDRPLLPTGAGGGGGGGVAPGGGGSGRSLNGLFSYMWQEYLPRLPSMYDWFPGYALYEVWFKGLIGQFGWGDYRFPNWVNQLMLGVALCVIAGVLAQLVRLRRALTTRLAEIACYAVMALGLLVLLAYVGYNYGVGGTFEQGRYLLPLLAPMIAFVALGLTALGDRFGRLAGIVLVLLSFGLTLYAHMLTVARFYA